MMNDRSLQIIVHKTELHFANTFKVKHVTGLLDFAMKLIRKMEFWLATVKFNKV